MVNALKQPNTIELHNAKHQNRHGETDFTADKHQDLKLKILAALQSSLDLTQLMEKLQKELNELLSLDGLTYINEVCGIDLTTGSTATHSCGYRLITQQDLLGEITFYRSRRFAESDLEVLEVILGLVIFPLRNALTYREALVASLCDPLTGAGNRIALGNSLNREIELAKRHDSPLALLLIDVDDFKNINDSYGHVTGDHVLKEIARTFKEVNRQTDLSFRYGGEEFVLLLNKTDRAGALVFAERIRHSIETLKLESDLNTFQVTISLGVATLAGGESAEDLLKRADKALYQAKSKGKNQSVFL